MPREKQTKGKCVFCGIEIPKNGVSRHLNTCAPFKEAIARTERKKDPVSPHFHLRIQADRLPHYWLDLEMRGTATLKDLDKYLRAIWLECCGHLSQFSFGGWSGKAIGKTRQLMDVMDLGDVLTHIYDFGTSSETLIKVIGIRIGKPLSKHPIALLVRNVMPEEVCMVCKQPATKLCMECMIAHDVWGTLCNEHAINHPHDEYGDPIALVNSPRIGLCGYDGPAEPPY